MRGERIAAPIFALLIVLSGAGGAIAPGASPVGTAAAQSASNDECSTLDSLIYDALTIGNLNTDGENPCSAEYQRQQLADEWNETDSMETRTQIHSQTGQLKAGNKQFLTVQQNMLTDSNTIAFSKGEAAAVEVLSNGGNISEAKAAANESIADYYAVREINTWDRWEVVVETSDTLNKRVENVSGVDSDFITVGEKDDFGENFDSSDSGLVHSQIRGDPTTETVQLVNGSTIETQAISLKLQYYNNDVKKYDRKIGPSRINSGNWDVSIPEGTVRLSHIRVHPTSNLTSQRLDLTEYTDSIQEIHNKNKETKREVAVYIEESLGPAVNSGTLDAESYVSPATLAQEYAQEYGNGTSFIRATAIAAYSGMDAPDLEETGSMTITHNGTTYKGLLLSQEAPSGGWQSGETYDAALLSGLQMFAVAGENSSVVKLDGPFTIESITGTDGKEISKATTFNVTYETSNASANYSALQEQIRELNKKIEERQAQATSGPSSGDSGTNPLDALAAFLGVSAGAAVVVLIGAAAIVAKVYSPN